MLTGFRVCVLYDGCFITAAFNFNRTLSPLNPFKLTEVGKLQLSTSPEKRFSEAWGEGITRFCILVRVINHLLFT